MSKFLFISVKPEFADKIVRGEKTIELRKNKPSANPGDFVIIYSTLPVKSVIGFGIVKEIIEDTPQFMWNNHSEKLGIDNKRFDNYYCGMSKAVGIRIDSICKLKKPINLDEIKNLIPKFSPPQTYRYFSHYSALKLYLSLTKWPSSGTIYKS